MSFHDRHYNRSGGQGRGGFGSGGGGFGGGGGGDLGRRLLNLLNTSFSIGTYLDIRVRVHITFFLLVAFWVLPEIFKTGGEPVQVLRWMALLFLSVLLHEFGHCLACRSVGGTADDILMWPLGGLAMCLPPRRPWAEFVTVVWGPLVNVIIAAACFIGLLSTYGGNIPVTLNPFAMLRIPPNGVIPDSLIATLAIDLFLVNYVLLLFNLALIFYPFDGGRLVQIALWTKMGYVRSLRLACTFGMVGAVGVMIVGLSVPEFLLVLIGGFGFFTCYQQKRALQGVVADEGSYETYYDAGGTGGNAARVREGSFSRWRRTRRERARQREADERQRLEGRLDEILDKVHEKGLTSLTEREKRILRESTDQRRQH